MDLPVYRHPHTHRQFHSHCTRQMLSFWLSEHPELSIHLYRGGYLSCVNTILLFCAFPISNRILFDCRRMQAPLCSSYSEITLRVGLDTPSRRILYYAHVRFFNRIRKMFGIVYNFLTFSLLSKQISGSGRLSISRTAAYYISIKLASKSAKPLHSSFFCYL